MGGHGGPPLHRTHGCMALGGRLRLPRSIPVFAARRGRPLCLPFFKTTTRCARPPPAASRPPPPARDTRRRTGGACLGSKPPHEDGRARGVIRMGGHRGPPLHRTHGCMALGGNLRLPRFIQVFTARRGRPLCLPFFKTTTRSARPPPAASRPPPPAGDTRRRTGGACPKSESTRADGMGGHRGPPLQSGRQPGSFQITQRVAQASCLRSSLM